MEWLRDRTWGYSTILFFFSTNCFCIAERISSTTLWDQQFKPSHFKFRYIPLIFFPFLLSLSLQVYHSLTLSQPNNTDANVIETPGASSGSWSLASVPATPSPGSNFPSMKLQGPQLSSLFSNNSSTECECVSDWMVMSVPEIEPKSYPSPLKIDLFSRAKQIL